MDQKEIKKKEFRVTLIMTFIMAFVMGLLFIFLARRTAGKEAIENMPPALIMYFTGVIESIIVGLIVAIIIPFGKMGHALCKKFNATPPSFKFNALNSLPFGIGNAILLSAICSFISIAQSHARIPKEVAPPLLTMWFERWIKQVPISIIVGYVLALIISPFVVKAVGLGGPNGPKSPVGPNGPEKKEGPEE